MQWMMFSTRDEIGSVWMKIKQASFRGPRLSFYGHSTGMSKKHARGMDLIKADPSP